jgi:TatD DNase family protein
MGFCVSFAGNLTYPKAVELHQAAARVPEKSVLVETDSPFLIPQKAKNRKVRRNEPCHVMETAAKLAELRGWDLEKTSSIVTDNTLSCFPKLKSLQAWNSLHSAVNPGRNN